MGRVAGEAFHVQPTLNSILVMLSHGPWMLNVVSVQYELTLAGQTLKLYCQPRLCTVFPLLLVECCDCSMLWHTIALTSICPDTTQLGVRMVEVWAGIWLETEAIYLCEIKKWTYCSKPWACIFVILCKHRCRNKEMLEQRGVTVPTHLVCSVPCGCREMIEVEN